MRAQPRTRVATQSTRARCRHWTTAAGLLALSLTLDGRGAAPADEDRMRGFTLDGSRAQRELERRFAALPDSERIRKEHRFFTSEPHPAGSERNNELARYIADEWRTQGLEDVTVHRYDVLSSFPKSVELELVSPVAYRPTLREDAYPEDPDTANPRVRSGYLGYSTSGEITAPLVYAHSGNPDDYAYLERHGIDVKGKIVIVRYSNPYSYRGFKALTAERRGAAALLIYSDPAEDGFKKGKVFPDGPWGPESHIQRGAITYDFLVAGDPLTPGWAALPDAKRIPVEEATSVPKIMALAMSWRDAKPLLEQLDGPIAPASWQGGLPLKYRLGGSRARAHLKIDMDTRVMPNYVVEGRVRGSDLPDEWVILGNHRDAWEFGGVDPSSGTASLMEMTRAFGALKSTGVRPRRTLVFCSWDGEEVALTGSTEWGEHFAETLTRNAVAYLNVDSSTSGPTFEGSAVASLAPLLVDVSRTLTTPTGHTLYDDWRAAKASPTEGSTLPTSTTARGRHAVTDEDLVDVRIGSGSDHTVFLNHLGIPTMGLSFDGPYGVYHSMYDSYFWMNQFGDPGYRYHRLMSQLWGIVGLRLANAQALPFDMAFYAQSVRAFVDELAKANRGLAGKVDLRGLTSRLDAFATGARRLRTTVDERLTAGTLSSADANAVNRALMRVERQWLLPDGIPGRPWFKHSLYAARYTYAHLELPGVTEAVEGRNWVLAADQIAALERAVDANTSALTSVADALAKNGPVAIAPDDDRHRAPR
ncbi:MAG: M28 family metallopeptidase [Vicinamibacterales bacterium]